MAPQAVPDAFPACIAAFDGPLYINGQTFFDQTIGLTHMRSAARCLGAAWASSEVFRSPVNSFSFLLGMRAPADALVSAQGFLAVDSDLSSSSSDAESVGGGASRRGAFRRRDSAVECQRAGVARVERRARGVSYHVTQLLLGVP